ncbi:MAG: heavy metal translocating P-type ATPase [Clostridia bacterium]|nr:heavy metal translocating P-type ATPase [Clostridia bacterium]
MTKKHKKTLCRILAAAVMLAVLSLVDTHRWLLFALHLIPYLTVGGDILLKAAKGVKNRQPTDECFLMAVATIGAFAVGLIRTGDFGEAVFVMLFYQTGELFQSIAVRKSRRSIGALLDIRPDYANIERDGVLERVDPYELAVGSEIVVQPGERIPIDGTVISGESALDTSALTGESIPREVQAGDTVISGCINLSGLLHVRTAKEFGDSTVSRILELAENAASLKSNPERFVARFARVYTPAVCIAALALAVLPPAVRHFCGLESMWAEWLYRALTFLVISCPCALVLGIPLTFFAGIGGCSRVGILVKGSSCIESLSRACCMAFDKTGTLTRGVFGVREVLPVQGVSARELLQTAAVCESSSSHPIAKALQKSAPAPIDRTEISEVTEKGGMGVSVLYRGKKYTAGSLRLMESMGVTVSAPPYSGAAVYIAADGEYMGRITLCDTLKPNAADAVAQLKRAGISKTVILTGDTEQAARSAADGAGIDEVCHSLLPEDKVEHILRLKRCAPKNRTVVFAGDGINDAPVLAAADVGLAMGALGSDAAVESADIVIMDDDLGKTAKALRISKKVMNIVRQNIVFAIGIKLGCLLLGAVGLAGMPLAVFADVGVMVLAVLNALRALNTKNV